MQDTQNQGKSENLHSQHEDNVVHKNNFGTTIV